MQSKLAARDILNRNTHNNLFHLKLPSHNASKQSVLNQCHAFILNKLSLIPFEQDQKLTQLYKASLEHLIALPQEYYKNELFVQGVVEHLCNWEKHMSDFGTWPYTRAAFFSIQEKIKKNESLWERVIFQRAKLEPNKQQFLSKAMGQTFKNKDLNRLIEHLEGKQLEPMQQEHKYELPRDILLVDSDECWLVLQQQFEQLDRQSVMDYLDQYSVRGIETFLRKKLNLQSLPQVLKGLKIRQRVYELITKTSNSQIIQWLSILEQK